MLQGLHQRAAQPIPAFQVGVDNLKADFVGAGSAQQYLSANVADPDGNINVGFRSHPQIVFLCSHAAAQAEFANQNARSSPGTADDSRIRFTQDDTLVAPLPHPGASCSRTKGS